MNRFRLAARLTGSLFTHESARSGVPLRPLMRFGGWQALKRVLARPITIRAFDSGRLRCYPDSSASNAVLYFGWPDWHEMHFVRLLLRTGDVVVDAGANVGVYSVLAGTLVMPSGRVLAIEPEPGVADRLEENFVLNALDPSDIHRVALGDTETVAQFNVGRDCVGHVVSSDDDTLATTEVPVRTLDSIVSTQLAEDLSLAKLDLEGFELPALRGSTALLGARRARCWLIETNDACERFGHSRLELQELLREHGFTLYKVGQLGRRLSRVAMGGPYPQNCVAIENLDWIRSRIPDFRTS